MKTMNLTNERIPGDIFKSFHKSSVFLHDWRIDISKSQEYFLSFSSLSFENCLFPSDLSLKTFYLEKDEDLWLYTLLFDGRNRIFNKIQFEFGIWEETSRFIELDIKLYKDKVFNVNCILFFKGFDFYNYSLEELKIYNSFFSVTQGYDMERITEINNGLRILT